MSIIFFLWHNRQVPTYKMSRRLLFSNYYESWRTNVGALLSRSAAVANDSAGADNASPM